ncbi:MAG: glycosyltransferase [Woeseiaceae bacterium]|nr:glycosyltransferase [Woeseiaceae bacterium]
MKLIIQIPCFNEEASLPVTLADLPKSVEGFEEVEWLIIDDGSSDKTVSVARENGVQHVVRHVHNQGLARAFMTGLEACVSRGADVIVNTDADNQYNAADIETLVKPILEQRAEMVIGARPISETSHFSTLKKMLQRLGSWVVRIVSGTAIEDAPSGFRAISRDAATKLMVFNEYTYTLETIIQAGQKNIPVVSVPIRTNDDLRPSRLVRSMPSYVAKSMMTIVRIFIIYRPFRFFMTIGVVIFAIGTLIGLRFVWYYLTGEGGGKIQSLILAAVLLGMGFQTILIAFVADLLAANRKLLEEQRQKLRSVVSD